MKPIRVNLATFEYIDLRLAVLLITSATIIVMGVSLLNINAFFKNQDEISDYKKKIFHLEQVRLQKRTKITEKSAGIMPKDRKAVKMKTIFVNRLIADHIFPWSSLLEKFEQMVPDGLALDLFSPSDDFSQLVLIGRAASSRKISFLLKRIKESDLFYGTILSSIKIKDNENKDGMAGQNEKAGIEFTIKTGVNLERLFDKLKYGGLGKVYSLRRRKS